VTIQLLAGSLHSGGGVNWIVGGEVMLAGSVVGVGTNSVGVAIVRCSPLSLILEAQQAK
jgi:hypothetical protein